MSMYILFQSLRGSKRPPVAVPEKKPATQASQMSNELFQKLKRRRGQQGEGIEMDDSTLITKSLSVCVCVCVDMPDGKGAMSVSPEPDRQERSDEGERGESVEGMFGV